MGRVLSLNATICIVALVLRFVNSVAQEILTTAVVLCRGVAGVLQGLRGGLCGGVVAMYLIFYDKIY